MANVTTAEHRRPRRAPPRQPRLKPTVDFATLLGIFGAFAVIGTAMVLGGSPESFVDLPAILIVVFGTLLVTAISFSLEEVWRAGAVVWRTAVYHAEAPSLAAQQVIYLADVARRRGKLALQQGGSRATTGSSGSRATTGSSDRRATTGSSGSRATTGSSGRRAAARNSARRVARRTTATGRIGQ